MITKSSHYISIDEGKNSSNASKRTENWVPLAPVTKNSEVATPGEGRRGGVGSE